MYLSTRTKGTTGEDEALKYLLTKGYTLIERNYNAFAQSSGKEKGELDLIMQDGEFIVFIEVKSLEDASGYTIYESLTPTKKKRLGRAINNWLFKHNKVNAIWRLDFVGVVKTQTRYNIEHYEFISLD